LLQELKKIVMLGREQALLGCIPVRAPATLRLVTAYVALPLPLRENEEVQGFLAHPHVQS
jgi:hypothetical protein